MNICIHWMRLFFGITLFVKYAQGAFLQSDKCETGTFLFPHFVYNTLQCLIYCTSKKWECLCFVSICMPKVLRVAFSWIVASPYELEKLFWLYKTEYFRGIYAIFAQSWFWGISLEGRSSEDNKNLMDKTKTHARTEFLR